MIFTKIVNCTFTVIMGIHHFTYLLTYLLTYSETHMKLHL